MISKAAAERVLAEAVRTGGDFAELFMEDTRSSELSLVDGAIDSATTGRRHGAGIRIYNGSDKAIFLERKRKMGDLIQKSSVQITHRLCDQLADGNPAGLFKAQNPLLQDMYVQMRTRLLRPRVIVDYEREAYVHPAEDVRITFDMKLRTGLASRDLFNASLPTVCPHDRNVEILEVKFNNYLPDYINALLHGVEAERSAVSKYILCRRYEPLG